MQLLEKNNRGGTFSFIFLAFSVTGLTLLYNEDSEAYSCAFVNYLTEEDHGPLQYVLCFGLFHLLPHLGIRGSRPKRCSSEFQQTQNKHTNAV